MVGPETFQEASSDGVDLVGLMQLALDHQPAEEIRAVGLRLKALRWQRFLQLERRAKVIDSIVDCYAHDPNWVHGLQDPDWAYLAKHR